MVAHKIGHQVSKANYNKADYQNAKITMKQ